MARIKENNIFFWTKLLSLSLELKTARSTIIIRETSRKLRRFQGFRLEQRNTNERESLKNIVANCHKRAAKKVWELLRFAYDIYIYPASVAHNTGKTCEGNSIDACRS